MGAIDGKHVRIRCPQSFGSQFYNYKSYFSVHLQAIVDAKYKFMTVDITAYGRQSGSGVFTESSVFRHLEAGSFNLPSPRQISRTNITLPYVLVGDQGCPLKEYLMRPYPTDNDIVSRQIEIFNYRLSRAQRTVDCAFGILVAKWRCLKTELQANQEHVHTTIRTVCLLHCIIIDKEGVNETVAMTQITPKTTVMFEAQGATTVLNKMHVVYETGSCNILILKAQLIFNNKNRAYIIQTK